MKSDASQGPTYRVLELIARLPWWGGILSALAAYVLLHPIAELQVPAPTGTVKIVASAFAQLVILLAGLGQYLLPLTFLVIAAVSGFERWKRGNLRDSVVQDTSGSVLRGLRHRDFELLVTDALNRQGYEVRTPQSDSRSWGSAIELTRDGQLFLVDCSDWRSWKAGAGPIRRLHEQMNEAAAAGGFAVTSGLFTPEAKHCAADADIQLIDGRHLKELVCTESGPAKRDISLDVKALWAMFGRRKKSIPVAHPPKSALGRGNPDRSPSLESEADAAASALSTPVISEPASDEDAEAAAGRELAALIRAEHRGEEEIELRAPPLQGQAGNLSQPRPARVVYRTRYIANAAGMALSIAILWGSYAWFSAYPVEPMHTPWSLLGAKSDSGDLIRRLQGFTRSQPAISILEGQQPLGQYQFGPPQGFLSREHTQQDLPPKEPVEVYNSLRELETAFDAKYVPPPECYAFESSNQMVKCGNHRIRARQDFIASGGKVSPLLLGSWENPNDLVPEARPEDLLPPEGDEWEQHDFYDREQGSQSTTTQGQVQDWAQSSALQSEGNQQQGWLQRPAEDWPQSRSQSPEEDLSRYKRSEPIPVEKRHWVDDL